MKEISLRSLINPEPRQEEFLRATDTFKYILYGGAKGGGKSYILRWGLVRKLLKWAKDGYSGVRVGLFCENYPALKDRQITKIEKEFPRWLGTLGDSNIEGMSFRLFPQYGGGVVALRNLDDVSKYASSEFAIAAVDELTKNKRETFDQLRSIVRWPGISDTAFWGGTNPGEVGHLWVKKLWIDRTFHQSDDPPGEQFVFVKSLPTDNSHNSQSYIDDLKRLPEKLRKAYFDGNWDIFEGQYFSEWDKDRHVVAPFTIPATWKRFRSYDHGRENPAAMGWYALDYEGRVWKYRELYVRGKNVDELALEINRLSKDEVYEYSVADPSIFAHTGFVDRYGGQTIAESFARHGIMFIPASNRRIDGWSLMHQYLSWTNVRPPKLLYFSTCTDSIRTIPALIHDDHKPEDVDTDSEDHAPDSDRYFLMSLHERRGERPKSDVERKLEQLKQRDSMSVSNLNKIFYPS